MQTDALMIDLIERILKFDEERDNVSKKNIMTEFKKILENKNQKKEKKNVEKKKDEKKEECLALTKSGTRCKSPPSKKGENTKLCAYHNKNGIKFGMVVAPSSSEIEPSDANTEPDTDHNVLDEDDLFGNIQFNEQNIDKCDSEYEEEFE